MVVLHEHLTTFCYNCGVVGHGTNSCPRTPVTKKFGVSPPSRNQRGKAVDSNSNPRNVARVDGSSPPCGNDPSDDVHMALRDAPAENTESNYGPWLLTGHRRG